MKPQHAFVSMLVLASMAGCASAPGQQGADPGATALAVERGIGKYRSAPVGECAPPVYPREAQRYEIEGVATVRYKLLPSGRVSEPHVVKSSGWAILDDATIALALGCKYTPQQAAEVAGRELPLQFLWHLEGERVYANMLPATCGPAGAIEGFQPFDRQPGDAHGVKLRFLIDRAGVPHAVRFEGRDIAPALADAVLAYLGNCRFEFDPQAKGERTDTMYGRVLLR